MATTEKIQRITSKGQITLPMAWRKRVGVSTIVVHADGDHLSIRPARLEKSVSEYTVFDAIRDNNGRGIKAKDLVRMLKKMDR